VPRAVASEGSAFRTTDNRDIDCHSGRHPLERLPACLRQCLIAGQRAEAHGHRGPVGQRHCVLAHEVAVRSAGNRDGRGLANAPGPATGRRTDALLLKHSLQFFVVVSWTAAHVATETQQTLETFYDGFGGGWRWRDSFGSATTTLSTYTIGTLIIDLFDARSQMPIWRWTAMKTLSESPQRRADAIHKAIAQMFESFPATDRRRPR